MLAFANGKNAKIYLRVKGDDFESFRNFADDIQKAFVIDSQFPSRRDLVTCCQYDDLLQELVGK